MVLLTNQMNTNTVFTLDNNDGDLMIANVVAPGCYDKPSLVDWDSLNDQELQYYMDRHMYLLDEVMPEIADEFYPRF